MGPTRREYVGSYRLLRVIRLSKTCEIIEAIHDAKNRRFAIKMLQPAYVQNKEQLALLRHEYAVAKPLCHDGIIRVDECHIDRQLAYIRMEFFPAPNLKQIVQSDRSRITHLIPQIVRQAAEGLDYFHRRGWVHRDIKPDNFLVSDEGNVKLIDFALAQKPKRGLARLLGGRGKIQGTQSYMSPEQIRGDALDARTDIYGFGCMLHELLSGKPPFTGTTTKELLNRHLKSQPPRLKTANSNITDEFAELVKRMLAKDAAQRPESMEQILTELSAMRVFRKTPKPGNKAKGKRQK